MNDQTVINPQKINDETGGSVTIEAGQEPSTLGKTLDKLTFDNYESLKKEIGEMRTKIQQEHDKAEQLSEKLLDRIEEQKIKIIEVIGVFVSVFTFISIDIQIFKTNTNFWILTGFVLIMLASLLLFNISLKIILEDDLSFKKEEKYNLLDSFKIFEKKVVSKSVIKDPSTWTPGFVVLVGAIACLLVGIVFCIIGSLIGGGNSCVQPGT